MTTAEFNPYAEALAQEYDEVRAGRKAQRKRTNEFELHVKLAYDNEVMPMRELEDALGIQQGSVYRIMRRAAKRQDDNSDE